MNPKQDIPKHPRTHHGEEAGAVAGELVGAVVGSAAGPVGTVAGMVVGAVVGALTGRVLEEEGRKSRIHDEELDEAIGVTGGDLGGGRAGAPPEPSVAHDGEAVAGQSPPELPFPDVDDDG
jgi:phage tail tape-measure protein